MVVTIQVVVRISRIFKKSLQERMLKDVPEEPADIKVAQRATRQLGNKNKNNQNLSRFLAILWFGLLDCVRIGGIVTSGR